MAQAAIDAGISGSYGYPGTPSTEIIEYVQKMNERDDLGLFCKWSANEKTAMEEALGMSYAGKRAMVTMKHVGLNVAADAFVNSAITGVNGGLVVVVADDPSMHSSQNEQDSRFYAKFSFIPCFEPRNQQQAYDMIHAAFEYSEKVKLPVMFRVTTRISHSRSAVALQDRRAQNEVVLPTDHSQFVLLPANARRSYAELLARQSDFENDSSTSEFNVLGGGDDTSLGIISCGIACNYVDEVFADGCPHPYLKISQYPLPATLIKDLCGRCEKVLIAEEGQPLLEDQLRGILDQPVKVLGRMSGELPRTGELSPELISRALGNVVEAAELPTDILRGRPPQLCKGCPHIDIYQYINEVLADMGGTGRVFADIGCYTLGALPPFLAIHTCVDMGASITMAKGASDAGVYPAVAVIGDSTFTHSGMTGLLDAVAQNSNITVLILDNDTTAMTGQQDSLASGRLEDICAGLGVDPDHLHVTIPLPKNHEENMRVLREEIAHEGVSVIIPRRPCIQLKRRG